MKNYFKRTFALSEKGARGIVKASLYRTISNILLMAVSGIIILLLKDLVIPVLANSKPVFNLGIYIVYSISIMFLMVLVNRIEFNATYLTSYEESANKRISLAEVLRKLPLSFFGRKDTSDITTTLMADTTALETVFSQFVPHLIGSMVSTLVVGVALFFVNPLMALAAFWVIPISFLMIFLSKKELDKYYKEVKSIQLAYLWKAQEFVENIKDIKANNRKIEHLNMIESKLSDYEKASISGELKGGILITASQMVLKIGIATTMLMGINLLVANKIDVLVFMIFMIMVTRLYDPLGAALINLSAIFNTLQSSERMKELENTPIQDGKNYIYNKGYDIEFKDVVFAYKDNESVIKGLSFTAKQGEVTALIGPSGGGKTTAIKLAARFWDLDSGEITLGGEDISKVEPETLLKDYSIVFQDVTLFNNTVRENIRIGKKDATDEEVIKAAKDANCHQFVSSLPKGYDTFIGENGALLSGGERQRISIARALLKDAPVILLDEATSSVDILNETELQQAIGRLTENKTVIIVAHRMRTIIGADRIILIKDGKVSMEGKHQDMMEKSTDYKNMVNLQKESMNWSLK